MTYAEAKQRGDTRGMHTANLEARKDLHTALAKHEWGKRSRRAKRLEKMLEGR
jgi:hypothetical protein